MSFTYRIFYGICWTLALLPLSCLYFISDLLFFIVCYVVRYRRKIVMKNLHAAFPEKSEKERWRIARNFYKFMCDLFIETLKMTNISTDEIRRRIKYSNPEIYQDLYNKGIQLVIFIPGHYGNWEWIASLESTIPYHQAALYRPLRNKIFDRFFYDMRTKRGTDAIPHKLAVRAINKYKDENRPTTICFLSDQSPQHNATIHWTNFLNQDTAVFTGAEKLSKRYNMAVVYYEVRYVKRGYYEVDITLVTDNPSGTTNMEITEKHVRLLEDTIRRNPHYWLWSHRRWKLKRENKC